MQKSENGLQCIVTGAAQRRMYFPWGAGTVCAVLTVGFCLLLAEAFPSVSYPWWGMATAALLVQAVLFVLLLAAYALPGGPVRSHVYTSAQTIAEEGLYPEYFGFKLFQMDNYTDTVMLFEAASADEAPPLTAMMTNTAYNVDNFETLAEDLQWYIEKDLSTGAQRTDAPALVPFSYARY